MSSPGSNGVMDGERNVQQFKQWEMEVEDFRPFINQGALCIQKVADDAGIKRGVFYTNGKIRDELMPKLIERLAKDGLLTARMVVPTTIVIKGPRNSAATQSSVKMMQEQNEALKAENARLRKELEKHQAIRQILSETGRLPW
jgi:hypothetical protein